MQDSVSISIVLDNIRLPFGWTVAFTHVTKYEGGYYYLQVFDTNARDNDTGEEISWRGRKWLLSEHMTDGEIVQTVFKAVLTAMEHEVREQFLYRGFSIFDPHYDVDKLVELRRQPDAIKERE